MDELREKCPWDKKQTIQSLRQMTIEETYELADAITDENWKGIREELGDLLLHIVFYARIGREEKRFELDEVINGICEKLIARHPHIYGDVKVNDADDVKKNWEKLKLKEGKRSVIEGVPVSLPATVKAMRLQEKAKQVGFEWENKEQVWGKVEEEIEELKEAIAAGSQAKTEEEFGDLVFSLINYARFLQVDAENALEKTNKKFIHRFTQMEQQAMQNGKNLDTMTLGEMDAIWNTIKQQRPDQ
jgi:XTP/dITP diphosphohydrolase